MNADLFGDFLASGDTLWVSKNGTLLFSSRKERLLALLEYIEGFTPGQDGVIILDRVMGNAAALLSIRAGCREVYSPLGSQLAVVTFNKYGVTCHLDQVVPYICQANREDMCPMEKLSINQDPEGFYGIMKNMVNSP